MVEKRVPINSTERCTIYDIGVLNTKSSEIDEMGIIKRWMKDLLNRIPLHGNRAFIYSWYTVSTFMGVENFTRVKSTEPDPLMDEYYDFTIVLQFSSGAYNRSSEGGAVELSIDGFSKLLVRGKLSMLDIIGGNGSHVTKIDSIEWTTKRSPQKSDWSSEFFENRGGVTEIRSDIPDTLRRLLVRAIDCWWYEDDITRLKPEEV